VRARSNLRRNLVVSSREIPGADAAAAFGRKYSGPRRVAFVVNTDRGFLTHRAVWAIALQAAGARVRVYAPDTGYALRIRELGIEFVELDLGRESVSVMQALYAACRILVGLIFFRPQLVFLVQTAAYTVGWPAAVLLRRCIFVRVAGGIGRALSASGGRASSILALSLKLGARLRNVRSLFQQDADARLFIALGYAIPSRTAVVPGTGVDAAAWRPAASAPDPVTVMFVSRLYEEKGVRQFVEIARRLGGRARFVLVGEPDSGLSTAIPRDEIEAWVADGIEWWGHRDDMPDVFASASLIVFPSRHPEGTPKTLIEAAMSGVPAIASNQPGCKVVVEDGVTGWIFDSYDVAGMAAQVERLIEDPDSLRAAALASRERALRLFSLEVVLASVFQAVKVPSRVAS